MKLLEIELWFYSGAVLLILGTLGTILGPNVKDPLVRTINTEVAGIGISLIFLTYNHTLALLTFIAATTITTLVLLRAIIRLEEMEVDV